MDYQAALDHVWADLMEEPRLGEIATYIPELAKVNPDQLGISLYCLEDKHYSKGDAQVKFSIQSVSKVLSLALAIQLVGDEIWQRVDVEPSGNPFNSLVQLEYEDGIPRNPFINAGALVVTDILLSNLDEPKTDFLKFIRQISGVPSIEMDLNVAASEKRYGYRNAALASFLKSFGNLHNDVEEVLDFYFHQCAVAMSCYELSKTFSLFANHGYCRSTATNILSTTQVKRINAIMQTCGFYDEAGEFSFRVGLPGKSGVGGGIVAIQPRQFSVAVWSPRLNPKGNSYLGMKALELLTTQTGVSVF